MGAFASAEIQHSAQPATFAVSCAEDNATHPRLHQCARAHWARLECHDQCAVVEAPVAPQSGCLTQCHEFSVPERVVIQLTSVAPPTDRPACSIENNRCHWDLTREPHRFSTPQQTLHPGLGEATGFWGRGWWHRFWLRCQRTIDREGLSAAWQFPLGWRMVCLVARSCRQPPGTTVILAWPLFRIPSRPTIA